MQRLIAGESQTFPDVVLICDERDLHAEDDTTLHYPKLIVEESRFALEPTTVRSASIQTFAKGSVKRSRAWARMAATATARDSSE